MVLAVWHGILPIKAAESTDLKARSQARKGLFPRPVANLYASAWQGLARIKIKPQRVVGLEN